MEAVGLLGGPTFRQLALAIPLPNVARPGAFLADPFAQYQAEVLLERRGLLRVGVYHSHPGGSACLSAADQYFAAQVTLLQLVVAVARPGGREDEVRAYQTSDGATMEVPIHIR